MLPSQLPGSKPAPLPHPTPSSLPLLSRWPTSGWGGERKPPPSPFFPPLRGGGVGATPVCVQLSPSLFPRLVGTCAPCSLLKVLSKPSIKGRWLTMMKVRRARRTCILACHLCVQRNALLARARAFEPSLPFAAFALLTPRREIEHTQKRSQVSS